MAGPSEGKQGSGKSSDYDQIADKVGLVPNVRGGDNAFQAVFVLVTMALTIGAAFYFGVAVKPVNAFAIGAIVGLVLGGLLSGFALMVRGLFRS